MAQIVSGSVIRVIALRSADCSFLRRGAPGENAQSPIFATTLLPIFSGTSTSVLLPLYRVITSVPSSHFSYPQIFFNSVTELGLAFSSRIILFSALSRSAAKSAVRFLNSSSHAEHSV